MIQNESFEAVDPHIVPRKKLSGSVAQVLVAPRDHFVTEATDALELTLRGVVGDFHAGFARRSGGREPWYPRGTELRNERQLSLVAPDELVVAAAAMGLGELRAEWLGANLVLAGIPRLSMLPAGTLLYFDGGVTLKIDGQNHPCRYAGREIARRSGMLDIEAGSLLFPKHARRLRGLVAWVEKAGRIVAGEGITAKIPEQWIY